MANTIQLTIEVDDQGLVKIQNFEKKATESLGGVEKQSKSTGETGRLADYERLLGDAMGGDATLFARQDVVEAAWAIVDPVIHGPSPLYEYEGGTWGPPQSDPLVGGVGGWNTPV